MSALILIVEDEPDLLRTLEYNLKLEGYQTRTAGTGFEALDKASEAPIPNLIILDLMLPDIPGTEVCRRLRMQEATQNVPIIMATAKGEEIDRVVGFEVGADDYVVKPFSIREFLLRVRAVLRRVQPETQPKEELILFGPLKIDVSAHKSWVSGVEFRLTVLEFKLLTTLINRKGRVQSRETLLSDVWGIDADVTTRTVDTHVKRLREKMAPADRFVETVRGIGYRFSASVAEAEMQNS